MKKSSVMVDLILASGAPGLLLLALVFELILESFIPAQGQPIGASMRLVFLTPLFELLLMCALVGLIWAMNANRGYSRAVSAAYLIVGLLALYSNAVLAVLPLPDAWYVLTVFAAPDTMVFQAAAAIAALGLISLWFWSAAAQESAEIEAPSGSIPPAPGEMDGGD